MDSPGDVIGVSLLGFRGRVKQLGVDQRWWQNCQIIIQITVKGEEDEHRAMLKHRERGSIACEIYAKLALRRDVVRWALLRLRCSRVLQLTEPLPRGDNIRALLHASYKIWQ